MLIWFRYGKSETRRELWDVKRDMRDEMQDQNANAKTRMRKPECECELEHEKCNTIPAIFASPFPLLARPTLMLDSELFTHPLSLASPSYSSSHRKLTVLLSVSLVLFSISHPPSLTPLSSPSSSSSSLFLSSSSLSSHSSHSSSSIQDWKY